MDNKLVDLVNGKFEYNLGALNGEHLDKYDKLAIVALIGNNFQFIDKVESPEHNCIKVTHTTVPGSDAQIGMLTLTTDMTDQDNEISRSLCRLLYSMCTVMAIQFDKEIKVTDLKKYEDIIRKCSRQIDEKPLLHLFVSNWQHLAGAKHGQKYWNDKFPDHSLNDFFSKIKCFLVPSVGMSYEVVEMFLFNYDEMTFVDNLCMHKVEGLLKSLPSNVIKQIESGPTPTPRVPRIEQLVKDTMTKMNELVRHNNVCSIGEMQISSPSVVDKPVEGVQQSVKPITIREVMAMKSVNQVTDALSKMSLVDNHDNSFGLKASTSTLPLALRFNKTEPVVDDCMIKNNKQTIVQQDTTTLISQTEQTPRSFGRSQEMKTYFGSGKETAEQIMRDVLKKKSVNRMTEQLSMLSLVDQQVNAFGSQASTSGQSTGSNEMTKINNGFDCVIKVFPIFKKEGEPIAVLKSSCTSGIISNDATKPGIAKKIDVSQYHLANNIKDIIKNNFSAYLKLNNQTDVEKKLQDDCLAKFDINLNKAFVQDYSIIIVLLIEFKNIWQNKLKQETFDKFSLVKMLNSTSNRTKVDYKLVNYYNSLEQLIIAKIELINNENLENEAKLCQDALDYICDMSIEWLAKLNSSSSFNNNNINEFYDNFVSYSSNSLRKNLKNNSVSEKRVEHYCNKLETPLYARMNNN